jgi:hypothetical protein
MHATRVDDVIEAARPIGVEPRATLHDAASDFIDVLLRKASQAPQLHAMGLARLRRAPAEIGIVHLDAVGRLALVAPQHQLPELVVHR